MAKIERDPNRRARLSDIEQKKIDFLDALEQTLGIVSTACNRVSIPHSRYRKWMERDPEFKKAVEQVADVTIDYVETQLFRQIQEGNAQATMFYLRTRAKHRGYVETPMLNIDTINPIQILLPTGVNPPELPTTIDITPEDDEDE